MPINEKINLEYIIKNESFLTDPFLSTDRFISYCNDCGIVTSKEQLEQFEKLGIFYPIARVQNPKIKIKVEYINEGSAYRDLGPLKEGEDWSGDTKENYVYFSFGEDPSNWLKEGFLWEPSSRPFQKWKTFFDENRKMENFYSIFQCYSLYNLIQSTECCHIGFEWWVDYDIETINKLIENISSWSKLTIDSLKKNGIRGEKAVIICQIISNRYFPLTQSDKRTIQVPGYDKFYHYKNWHEYCRNWDAKKVLLDIGIGIDELKHLQELTATYANDIDPLEIWYDLINFVSIEKKKKLKGKALFAQTLHSMEKMLRFFYEDLTGIKLPSPDELYNNWKERRYGKEVTNDELQYLEFLANEYHLNPRPKLILVVEGNGEEEQFPRLAKELFGISFSTLGIEVINIHGIGGFEGEKSTEKSGALEKFIDDYHFRQTIVFVVLDNEGRVFKIKHKLIGLTSKRYPKRKVTKEEYIQLWNKNIEFDNFNHEEIAKAMSEFCDRRYTFMIYEIQECEKLYSKERNPLGKLFKEKLNYDLDKPKLLNILFGYIILNSSNEFDSNGNAKRPVVKIMQRIIKLAKDNSYCQPHSRDTWEWNQESGNFGDSTMAGCK
ncbi:MAG: hypothetical protein FIB07_06610 [Candidatus Methanoperedens sp.]|nr:hypothetical protein [Candidatus Methanoperedens sp.]